MNDQLFDLLGNDGEVYGPYRVTELQKLIDDNRADRQSQIRGQERGGGEDQGSGEGEKGWGRSLQEGSGEAEV